MDYNPLVSVVILNWNGEELLEECIESVLKTKYSPIEIVVVDNNSSDSSLSLLKKFTSVKIVINDKNYGYAKGNNIGIAQCTGKYVVTLNNDVVVTPDWLDTPVKILEKNETIGIIGCRLMSYYDHDIIDGLYHTIRADLTFLPLGKNSPINHDPVYCKAGYVISVNGGSAVIRKDMFVQIGGFDERFFAYFDEPDLCMRAFLAGWRSYYCPESVVYHKGSVSFKKTGIYAYYLRERNRIWFLYKFIPFYMIIWHLFFLVILELRVIRVMCIKMRQPGQYLRCRKESWFSLWHYKETRKTNLSLLKTRLDEFKQLKKNGLLSSVVLMKGDV